MSAGLVPWNAGKVGWVGRLALALALAYGGGAGGARFGGVMNEPACREVSGDTGELPTAAGAVSVLISFLLGTLG